MSPAADNELMLKVRDGDLGKLSFLFERYHRALFNFFLRSTGSRDLSEDLVQEVFLRILKYRHTFRPDSFSRGLESVGEGSLQQWRDLQ